MRLRNDATLGSHSRCVGAQVSDEAVASGSAGILNHVIAVHVVGAGRVFRGQPHLRI